MTKIPPYFLLRRGVGILTNRDFRVLQSSAETLFRWSGKHYQCVVTKKLGEVNANNYEKLQFLLEMFKK